MAKRMISGVVDKPDILKITRSKNYDSLYNFISLNSDGRSQAWLTIKDEFGLTALHIAVINNDMRCLKLLIDCQAKKEAEDFDGRTPLHFAAIHGYWDILMLLIEEPATLRSVPDHNGCTPLHEACRNGHYNCVVSLVIPNPLVPDRGALRNAETTYGNKLCNIV
jgi:ankyrin repeat protein